MRRNGTDGPHVPNDRTNGSITPKATLHQNKSPFKIRNSRLDTDPESQIVEQLYFVDYSHAFFFLFKKNQSGFHGFFVCEKKKNLLTLHSTYLALLWFTSLSLQRPTN